MAENKLTGNVVWLAQPERITNCDMLDEKHQISNEIQIFPIDEFESVRHLYKGLESLNVNQSAENEGVVLVKHPFVPDAYCELSENLDLDFIDKKFHIIGEICNYLGVRKCEFIYSEAKSRERHCNGNFVAQVKYLCLGIFGKKQEVRDRTTKLYFNAPCTGVASDDRYRMAVEIAQKYNLMTDTTVEHLLKHCKPSDPKWKQPYIETIVINRGINELFDAAFTLGGLSFFSSFDTKYKKFVQYCEQIQVGVHILY